MPKGISLHVGINQASSAFPNAATLKGCENDAREMEKIAVAKGFDTHDLLLGSEATYVRVTTKIRNAAAQLEKDDIFLFTFAGHGFQEVDRRPDRDEADRLDETLLLFDVELFDDVLRKDLWPCFKAGVRILMIADSCHSENVFRLSPDPAAPQLHANAAADVDLSAIDEFLVRTPDLLTARRISNATGRLHQAEYGEFYRNTRLPLVGPAINASAILLAACKSSQTTGDGTPNGIYTAAMLKVLRDSAPVNYKDLVEKIQAELTAAGRPQNPTIEFAGADDPIFREQRPFTV